MAREATQLFFDERLSSHLSAPSSIFGSAIQAVFATKEYQGQLG
jgi:hypothetical protein